MFVWTCQMWRTWQSMINNRKDSQTDGKVIRMRERERKKSSYTDNRFWRFENQTEIYRISWMKHLKSIKPSNNKDPFHNFRFSFQSWRKREKGNGRMNEWENEVDTKEKESGENIALWILFTWNRSSIRVQKLEAKRADYCQVQTS